MILIFEVLLCLSCIKMVISRSHFSIFLDFHFRILSLRALMRLSKSVSLISGIRMHFEKNIRLIKTGLLNWHRG